MSKIWEYIRSYEQIYIYGAGYYGRLCRVFLVEQNIKIEGFIQSCSSNVTEVLGLKIRELSEIDTGDDVGIVVAVSKKYRIEISKELKKHHLNFFMLSDDDLIEMENKCQFSVDFPIKNFVNVLLYHRVNEIKSKTRELSVSPSHFEEQMRFLKENYKILRFEDDWSNIKEKSIVITFDDGYADFYRYALPIIDKLNIPVTLFVTTGYVDTTNQIWTDTLEDILFQSKESEKTFYDIFIDLTSDKDKLVAFYKLRLYLKNMIPDEREAKLKELAKLLNVTLSTSEKNRFLSKKELEIVSKSLNITIGAHTVTHNMLSAEPLEMQKYELYESKEFLESVIGHSVDILSYPYGGREDFTKETVAIAKDLGYLKVAAAFAGIASRDDEFGYIPRNGVLDWELKIFQNKIRGMYFLYN